MKVICRAFALYQFCQFVTVNDWGDTLIISSYRKFCLLPFAFCRSTMQPAKKRIWSKFFRTVHSFLFERILFSEISKSLDAFQRAWLAGLSLCRKCNPARILLVELCYSANAELVESVLRPTLRFGEGFLYFFLIPNIQFLKRSVRKRPSIVNGSDRTGLLQGLEIQVLETYVVRDSSYQGTPL